MNNNFYKQVIRKLPIGYAYLKIIWDDGCIPFDYEFVDVNSALKHLQNSRVQI